MEIRGLCHFYNKIGGKNTSRSRVIFAFHDLLIRLSYTSNNIFLRNFTMEIRGICHSDNKICKKNTSKSDVLFAFHDLLIRLRYTRNDTFSRNFTMKIRVLWQFYNKICDKNTLESYDIFAFHELLIRLRYTTNWIFFSLIHDLRRTMHSLAFKNWHYRIRHLILLHLTIHCLAYNVIRIELILNFFPEITSPYALLFDSVVFFFI